MLLRVLYRSLLRSARVYDAHPWNRAHLFSEPAIRSRLPAIEWYLDSSPCQHLVRTAFRQPLPSSPSPPDSLPRRLSSAFAVLRALRVHDYRLRMAAPSASTMSGSSSSSSSPYALESVGYDEGDGEGEEGGEGGEGEGEGDEFDDVDDEAAIASEAEALLDSTEFDSSEASLLRSALSHFSGHVQLLSLPHSSAPVLRLTLNNSRQRDGEDVDDSGRMGGAARVTAGDEGGGGKVVAVRAKQREIQVDEEGEGEEEEAAEREDEEDEAKLEEDLADLHLAALAEAKVDDATLLALHPFTPPQLSTLHDRHARLAALLTAAEPVVEEVDEAVGWFLAPDSDCPRHLRLTCEDYHRVLHHWMDRQEEFGMQDSRGGEGDEADEAHQQQQRREEEEEEEEEDDDEEEDEYEAREEAQSRLRLHAFIRMKESGYVLKRSLVKRLLKEANREGGTIIAMVLLRETAFGRLPDVDAATRAQRLAPFHAVVRGEHVKWDAAIPCPAPQLTGASTPPVPYLEAAGSDSARAEVEEQQTVRAQLLADGPLLELVIEASADVYYTDDVRTSYPDALSTDALDQPPTPTSAYLAPLTPHSSPSSLSHLGVELFSLFLLHSIPFTRRSTVSSLLYVANELQLPSLASLVLSKAHRDGLRITTSLLDNLTTIACNANHLHLALHTLTLHPSLHLPPPSAHTFATVFNLAMYGDEKAVDAAVVDRWARERGLTLKGWGVGEGEGDGVQAGRGGGRPALMFALLEEAARVGVRGEEVVREAQLVISREIVRSMKHKLRDIGQWIRAREEDAEEDDEDEDADEEDDDDNNDRR